MTPVEYEAVRIKVAQMLDSGSYFDVCPLRWIEGLVGHDMPSRDRVLLDAMHCVGWSKITPEVRNAMADALWRFIGPPPTPERTWKDRFLLWWERRKYAA